MRTITTATIAAALLSGLTGSATAQTVPAPGEVRLAANAPNRTSSAGFAYRARITSRETAAERVRLEVTLASGLSLRRLPASHAAYTRLRARYLEALDAWKSNRSRTARIAVVRRLQAFRLASNGINAAAQISTGTDGRTAVLVTIPKIPEDGVRRFVVLVEPTVPAPASFTTEFTFTRAPAFRRTLDPVELVTDLPGPTFVSATAE
ncbi:MAG: hypothetical protein R2878_00865 [Thermoleophilia bacterium]